MPEAISKVKEDFEVINQFILFRVIYNITIEFKCTRAENFRVDQALIPIWRLIKRGEQALFNLKIKKKSGSSINPDIHHSKFPSSGSSELYFLNKNLIEDQTNRQR